MEEIVKVARALIYKDLWPLLIEIISIGKGGISERKGYFTFKGTKKKHLKSTLIFWN